VYGNGWALRNKRRGVNRLIAVLEHLLQQRAPPSYRRYRRRVADAGRCGADQVARLLAAALWKERKEKSKPARGAGMRVEGVLLQLFYARRNTLSSA
jgi:hypothetical protein